MSKIFGDFDNIHDLNATAYNLRVAQEYDDLLVLGLENGLDEETIKSYYESKSLCLIPEGEAVLKNNNDKEVSKNTDNVIEITRNQEVLKTSDEDKSNTDVIQQAKTKLEEESKKSKNIKIPCQPITQYLINECMELEFSKLVIEESKYLQRCFDYIKEKVRKRLAGSNGWIADDEVYTWAKEYYIFDNEQIEKVIHAVKQTNTYEKAETKIENTPKEELIPKTEPLKKNKGKKEQSEGLVQMSLFDLGGV